MTNREKMESADLDTLEQMREAIVGEAEDVLVRFQPRLSEHRAQEILRLTREATDLDLTVPSGRQRLIEGYEQLYALIWGRNEHQETAAKSA